jgi:predicted Zn-dependent protease
MKILIFLISSVFAQAIFHPVIFHVIHKSDSTGNVTNKMLTDQISVLNDAFSKLGIVYSIKEVRRYQDDALFITCNSQLIKSRFSYKTDTHLNIYTCSLFMIGQASLPGQRDPNNQFRLVPNNHYMYGIRLDYGALPGSTLKNYNLGKVLVHEVGHFYGLLHPYQDGCNLGLPSDFIEDTPRMSGIITGNCNRRKKGRCPGQKSPDYSNYMMSTFDKCRNHFTSGQIQFMKNTITTKKPELFKN